MDNQQNEFEEQRLDEISEPAENTQTVFASPLDAAAGQNEAQSSAILTDAAPSPKRKKHGRAGRRVLAAGLAVLLVAGSCGATAFVLNGRWQQRMDEMVRELDGKWQRRVDTLSASMEEEVNSLRSEMKYAGTVPGSQMSAENGMMSPSQVYAKCKNSVVAITNQVSGTRGEYQTASTGTGFILTQDGYVVSNCHVVSGAQRLLVTTYAGEEYEAKLIGADETNDVAVLKIEAEGLDAVTLGSSDAIVVGSQVVAIGNPLGELTSTQTVGYISGKNRSVSTDGTVMNMLQTDAAINPGNSGGPLFDMYGAVVGITTAKYSGTTSSGASIEGIGFAIPIDDVIGILDDLKNVGYVTGAYLGVSVSNMNVSTAEIYGLPVGAYVRSVEPGSCAEKAGIQPKDIITRIGGYDVGNISDLSRAMRKLDAGDEVTVNLFRAGAELTLTLTLDEKPKPETVQSSAEQPPATEEDSDEDNGFFFPFFGGGN